jgi:hypothetical protein
VYAIRARSDSIIFDYFDHSFVVFWYAVGITSPSQRRHAAASRTHDQRLCVPIDAKPLDPQQLKAWLTAAGKRDAAAFRALYDASASKLFGFALRILHKRELAEEVLQESFVAIWNNAANYQSHLAAPMTWMATIIRNKAFA